MHLLTTLDPVPPAILGGAVTIGNFDGVHRGHARLIAQLRDAAARVNGPAVVFTFDPHPVRILRPEHAPPPLTWTARKAELLAALGVDVVIAYPTGEALLALDAATFFQNIVVEKLAARAMIEGENFRFGRGRTGDIGLLSQLATAAGVELLLAETVNDGGEVVSSSRVRKLIAAGEVATASQLLTAPYRIRGMVVHGAGRGSKIGFATANVDAIDTLLPCAAVYAGRAWVPTPQGKQPWPAAINIGPNPTFGEHALKVEVHLIGFAGNLYGEPLEVDFLAKLRDIQRFESLAALQSQLAVDVERARSLAK